MASINTQSVFRFSDGDDSIEVIESDGGYSEVREKICGEKGFTIREFENDWSLDSKSTHTYFEDAPWESEEELEEFFRSIPSVDGVVYVSPMEGAYGPPTYLLLTDGETERVKRCVKEYYDGLIVECETENVEVLVSSVLYKEKFD
jgi:hypothetical protein